MSSEARRGTSGVALVLLAAIVAGQCCATAVQPVNATQRFSSIEHRPLSSHSPASFTVPKHVREVLTLDWVEAISIENSSKLVRTRVLTSTLDVSVLANETHPAVFVLNLDRRSDRLSQFVASWESKGVTILRVPARLHKRIGSLRLNGCALSHIALILAMERHGWPYVIMLEDDADPTAAWSTLLPPVLDYVHAQDGEVGWINLAPTFLLHPVKPAVTGVLWHVGGFLVSQSVIYGRRMIPAAHAFIREHAALGRRGPAKPNDQAWGRDHLGVGPPDLLVPAAVMTLQRVSFSDVEGEARNYTHLWQASDRALGRAAQRHRWPALNVTRVG